MDCSNVFLNPPPFLSYYMFPFVFRIYFSRYSLQSAPDSVKWSTPSLHPNPHSIPNSDVPHPQCLPSAEHIRTGKNTELEFKTLPLQLKNVNQVCCVAPVRLAVPFNLITLVNILTLSGWLITLLSK